MVRHQRGASILTVVLIVVIVVFFVLLGFKCVPVYTEYFGIKRIVSDLVKESGNASPAEIKESFERKMSIEYAGAVSAEDLDIDKDGGGLAIGVEYDKHIPLFGDADSSHVDLLFHFKIRAGRSGGAGAE